MRRRPLETKEEPTKMNEDTPTGSGVCHVRADSHRLHLSPPGPKLRLPGHAQTQTSGQPDSYILARNLAETEIEQTQEIIRFQ